MITAKELELDHNKHGITVVGTYGPKTIIKYDFENGDNVGLRKGEIKIEVENVAKEAEGTFTGIIKSINPQKSLEIDDRSEISFTYNNIFVCMKN
jgi:hypothetical protein